MTKRIVTFGEIMLRLAPEGYYRFLQASSFGAVYGGAEASVAVSLANYGFQVSYVTKLPKNELGQAALNKIRQFGVDTSHIIRQEGRLGIYFLEKGASQRPSKVIYDRADSVFAKSKPGDFDWEKIFEGVSWFHFTGITAALSPDMSALCIEACKAAKEAGAMISCDLNYRAKLWTRDEARKIMSEVCRYVDVCIANEGDADDVFGIRSGETDVTTGKLNHEGYIDVAKQLTDMFNFKKVAITLRESISASENNWSAMVYENGKAHFSRVYNMNIVDRVGGGDSFGAGLIAATLMGYDAQSSIEFAVAASCLKHTIEGDANMVSLDEVKKLAGGDASGRVQR